MRVGAQLEHAALATPQLPAAVSAEASPIALGIDAGHVRSVRSDQVRSFETFAAQVGGANDDAVGLGSPLPFAQDCTLKQELVRRHAIERGLGHFR